MSKRGALGKALIGLTLAWLIIVGIAGVVTADDGLMQTMQFFGSVAILGILFVGHFALGE